MKVQWRLLRYAWPHRGHVGGLLATMLVTIGLEALRPWPTKLMVDHILGQQPVPERLDRLLTTIPGSHGVAGLLLWVCMSTVVISLALTLVSMVYTSVSVTLGHRLAYDLGADLFLHLERLPVSFHHRRSVSDMTARVTEDAFCVQALITGTLLPFLHSACMLMAMFAIMWSLEPTMTLLSLSVAPFLMLSIWAFGERLKERCRERRDLEVRMMSLVQQTLGAIPVVQAFTREEFEHARFRTYSDETLVSHRRAISADIWFKLFVGLITSVGTASIMWLGARYAIESRVTVGTILVFLSYLGSLYAPLHALTYTASTWHSTAAIVDRVMEILNTPTEIANLPGARRVKLQGHVCFADVTFGYDVDRPVLHTISFDAEVGEVVAIVGPTGAGKTTLVNLLMRFADPWCGCVMIDGQDIRHLNLRSLRQQIATVFQEAFILPLTVAENIAYSRPEARRAEVVAAAVAAHVDDFIRRLPQGYDTVIGERGATLSGGEKQRLALARAFLKDAPILILDEPTSALDARTESLLLDALERLRQGRTTFIIAHRLSTIRNADRILVLDRGRIVEQGRHAELLRQDRLYTRLYRQQMEIARHASPPSGQAEPTLPHLTGVQAWETPEANGARHAG
jgi:ATP-binding cassette, subfamily B, bacterial